MIRKSIAIVNPIAGGARATTTENQIRSWIGSGDNPCDVVLTRYHGHGSAIAADAIQQGYNHFVVAGGDGTVNEVATVLMNHPNVSMGILPCGSGNGLARHLKLPMRTNLALDIAFGPNTLRADVGLLNGKPFFSVAGVGFDAMVAHKFSQMKGRGMKNYVKAVLKNFPAYKPEKYELEIDGKVISTTALMITFANSNQFGNNTSLSPDSDLTDGQIEVCIMKKPSVSSAIVISPLLFLKKMNRTKYLQIIKATKASIQVTLPAYIHLDGDPHLLCENEIHLETLPAALSIHVK